MTSNELLACWPRVRADIVEKAFVECDAELLLIERDLKRWCEHVAADIADNGFVPDVLHICDVPKGKGAVRPGSILTARDRAIFSAVVNRFRPQAAAALEWSQGRIDVGHQMLRHDSDRWFRSRFECWKAFSTKSIQLAETEDINFIVNADIAGYCECIAHDLLFSRLREIGAVNADIEILRKYLSYWHSNSRGLPQACSASDLLGKIFLTELDRGLQQAGYTHVRYVDDIRIFCRTRVEALRAIIVLTGLLRSRGLILQSA